jgi:hypothetical protein
MQEERFSHTLHWCIRQDFQATRHCVTCCILIRLSHRMLTVKLLHKGTASSIEKITAAHKQERDNMTITNEYNTLPCTRLFNKQYDFSVLTFYPWMPECWTACINKHSYTLPLRNVHTCALSHVHTYTYVSNATNTC